MFIYGPGEHQFGELDYAWVQKNELRIRTRGGMVFGELYATENIAAGELLRIMRSARDAGEVRCPGRQSRHLQCV